MLSVSLNKTFLSLLRVLPECTSCDTRRSYSRCLTWMHVLWYQAFLQQVSYLNARPVIPGVLTAGVLPECTSCDTRRSYSRCLTWMHVLWYQAPDTASSSVTQKVHCTLHYCVSYLNARPVIPGVLTAGCTQCVVRAPGLHRVHADWAGGVGGAVERQSVAHLARLLRSVLGAVRSGQPKQKRS